MRVLIVNTSDKKGGAAVAANRLAESLINNGIKAKMMVMEKQTDSIYVSSCTSNIRGLIDFLWERLIIWLNNAMSRKRLFDVSIANSGTDITSTPEFAESDIIHLHWINQGMLSLAGIRKILKSGKPVVWTMHDMWEMTGICHHAFECKGYEKECGECPLLRMSWEHDLSAQTFRKKHETYAEGRLYFTAVSKWLADKANASALTKQHPVFVVPNPLPVSKFKIYPQEEARTELKLPKGDIIVFGAARLDQPIKGMEYLINALKIIVQRSPETAKNLHLVLFGGYKNPDFFDMIPISHTYLGYIKDEQKLSLLYSAAQITVSSSLYETFGQTLAEAQACGCTPVSFGNSGQADIINHKENGYIAKWKSAEDLANGIEWALNARIPREVLRKNAVTRFSENVVATQFIKLYDNILSKRI